MYCQLVPSVLLPSTIACVFINIICIVEGRSRAQLIGMFDHVGVFYNRF